MNILFVTEKFPYPLDNGGNVRTYNILRFLSSIHNVTLVSTIAAEVTQDEQRHIRKMCSKMALVREHKTGVLRDLLVLIKSSCLGRSFLLERRYSKSFAQKINQIVREASQDTSTKAGPARGFDAVHFNHLDAGMYEPLVPSNVARVLDAHNVVTNQVATTAKVERSAVKKLILKREEKYLRTFEVNITNRMNLCLTCSAVDKEAMRFLGVTSKIELTENGVEEGYFKLVQKITDKQNLIFVGALDYDPCEKAVWFFLEAVLPLIRRKYSGVKFTIVGRNPSNRLRRAAEQDDKVILTGRVPDVREIVRSASVFVVPILSGSGTRLKILEALAMGIPVVTTSRGVEGIEVISGRDVLVADSPNEFAEAVCLLLQDKMLSEKLRKSGRQLIEKKYTWSRIGEELLGHYSELIAES